MIEDLSFVHIIMATYHIRRCAWFFTALVVMGLCYILNLVEHINTEFTFRDRRMVKQMIKQSNSSSFMLKKEMSNTVLSCNKAAVYLPGYIPEDRDEELIVYSELGKCGSGTLVSIITSACRLTKRYTTRYFWPIPDLEPSDERHKYIKTHILSQRKPFIFMGHLRFVDFTEFGYKQPIYIDWIRDPVERLISLYNYERRETNVTNGLIKEEMERPLDECIQIWINETGCRDAADLPTCLRSRAHKGCTSKGIEPVYSQAYSGRPYNKSKEVLINMAKSNIERYYIFIGLNEHYTESVKGLEKILRFQDKLSAIYKTVLRVNVGKKKSRPSNSSIKLLKTLLADDYVIYEFIRQRLYIHLKCLGIFKDTIMTMKTIFYLCLALAMSVEMVSSEISKRQDDLCTREECRNGQYCNNDVDCPDDNTCKHEQNYAPYCACFYCRPGLI
ncbi:unnamed protein product [Owenia fusiformis]|uniref:Sulfotransferase n=1 Tax=Owenia fusiformis TaxID=6347 RepID=A0A8S4NZL2_OWEFU|nr:unnamed protein product [Owenia fusiformis]